MKTAHTLNPTAIEAHKLSAKGLCGKALAEALGVETRMARNLASVGRRIVEIDEARFTDAELLLLRTIAKVARDYLAAGDAGSVKTFDVACQARRSQGWPTSVARKRLTKTTTWDAGTRSYRVDGLDLVDVTGNGYIGLTSLGWMIVHAIEAARAA